MLIQRKTRFLYLLVLAALIMAGCAGARETPAPQPTFTSIPQPTATVAVQTQIAPVTGVTVTPASPFKIYSDPDLGVSFAYPLDWQAQSNGRLEGPDGFAWVEVLADDARGPGAACQGEANLDKPRRFGAYPQIIDFKVGALDSGSDTPLISPSGQPVGKQAEQGQEACLILSSEDQPADRKGEALLLAWHPSDSRSDRVLALHADREHITAIAESLRFTSGAAVAVSHCTFVAQPAKPTTEHVGGLRIDSYLLTQPETDSAQSSAMPVTGKQGTLGALTVTASPQVTNLPAQSATPGPQSATPGPQSATPGPQSTTNPEQAIPSTPQNVANVSQAADGCSPFQEPEAFYQRVDEGPAAARETQLIANQWSAARIARLNQRIAPLGYRIQTYTGSSGNKLIKIVSRRDGRTIRANISWLGQLTIRADGEDFILPMIDSYNAASFILRADGLHGFEEADLMVFDNIFPVLVGSDEIRLAYDYERYPRPVGSPALLNIYRGDELIDTLSVSRSSPARGPVRGLWAWENHWMLELPDRVYQDGVSLNEALGYDKMFNWRLLDEHPFYFFGKDGQIYISYNGATLPDAYDEVIHDPQVDMSVLLQMKTYTNGLIFYARRDGAWYYVIMEAE